ncbi:MAG: hypothetical protein KGQ59_02685 [Bdellovibrionales bacterium]|nr:hypothetical protein [Bdellovibrionales bacterium]
MQLFKINSWVGLVLGLALSSVLVGCGGNQFATYAVTKITCNGVDLQDPQPAPSDLEIKLEEKSGYLMYRNWGAQTGCTAIFSQSYSWTSDTSVTGTFSSCSTTGTCSLDPCTAWASHDLGPITIEDQDGKISVLQSVSLKPNQFGEECTDSGEGGLPAKLNLQRL